ncbi:MAG: LysR family transcriptional regulator [Fibrobacterota bacterium]
MHVGSLQVFCDTVKRQSFSAAAKKNGMTQSGASQAVHGLEARLGASLIDRSHRPWKLTPEGRAFYDGIREVLDRYSELENRVKNFHGQIDSIVRVGSIYSVGLRHMKTYIQCFSELYPSERVHIEYLHPDRVYECVQSEEVDLGIVSFPQTSRGGLTVIPWRQEPMVVACHPDHRFARKGSVAPAQLSGENFVGFDRGLAIRREVDRFLKRHEAAVEVVLEFDNIESIKRAVEIASGIAILPCPSLDSEVQMKTLCVVPFTTREFVRPLGILHRRGKTFSTATRHFLDFLQKEKKAS